MKEYMDGKRHVKKISSSPPPLKNASFFSQNKKKCLECSETREYAKIFREIAVFFL